MSRKLILLVEDNPDTVELTIRVLRRQDISTDVVIARDGAEALEYLFGNHTQTHANGHQTPVVVLLDLKLPKVDGLEVLRRIRADDRTRLLPVVVLSSSNEERDILESYRLGANSYVHKPVNFTDFSEAIKRLGQYWLSINHPSPHN